jgi:mycothiol synthase
MVLDNSGAQHAGMGQAARVTAAATPTTFRQLTTDDVEAIVELNALCDIAETGQPDQEVITWIRDGVEDYAAYGVFDDAGLAGCGWIDTDPSGRTGFEGDVRVRPGVDTVIGDPLLAAIRKVAAATDPARPLHLFANASAERARGWLESHGATLIRHFWRMRIDLEPGPVTVPDPPAGVTLRRVRDEETDLREVFRVVDTAFEDHFGHEAGRTFEQWMTAARKRSHFDLSLWSLAEIENRPVAALIGALLPDAETEWIGHVGTLATLREARGRGIGTLLLRAAFAEFAERGVRSVALGVDAANLTGAVRLYEAAGMHVAHEWVLYELPPARSAD